MRLKSRLVGTLVSLSLLGFGALAAAPAASAAAPTCLNGMSHPGGWSITNRCGRTVTFTRIIPLAPDQKITLRANQQIFFCGVNHGIK